MIRLFVQNKFAGVESISLSENQIHYLLHVMRQEAGKTIGIFNGCEGEWLAEITELSKKKGIIKPVRQTRVQEKEKEIILCPALIKKENMDWVFQKATELGVTEIFPLITERTVIPKLNTDRAKMIVTEAAEQCERLTVPTIHEPMKLKEFLKNFNADFKIVCLSERGETVLTKDTQKKQAFCIGPEGGWTTEELKLFEQTGADFLHLGTTILRAETAAVMAMAYVQLKP